MAWMAFGQAGALLLTTGRTNSSLLEAMYRLSLVWTRAPHRGMWRRIDLLMPLYRVMFVYGLNIPKPHIP